MAAEHTISGAVVEAVAAEEGVTPSQLSKPLYSVIDSYALDALFRSTSGSVTFTYYGYEVTVDATDQIELEPLE